MKVAEQAKGLLFIILNQYPLRSTVATDNAEALSIG
jgi:hypothetical protein